MDLKKALKLIKAEREKARENIDPDFELSNEPNDYIAYVTAYLGRAADKVHRNEREGQTFTANMVKAAALILAALEHHGEE